jgi:hypothetical protein
MDGVKLLTVLTLVGVGSVAWSGGALAKAPPPKAKDLSAISQYRESIPSASGPTLPSGSNSTRTPLPPAVTQKVLSQGGSDAPALKKFAEQSGFGAPKRHSLPPVSPRQIVTEDQVATLPHAVFASAGNLVTDGQDGRVVGLLVVMGLLAVAAAFAAVWRRRPAIARD